MAEREIVVIGGGLAGAEAAWQAIRAGVAATVIEMKPVRFSDAHRSPFLAELVCSNSLKSRSLDHASGVLKEEMRRLGSVVLEAAEATALPAGSALAVDRESFSRHVTHALEQAGVRVVRKEATEIPDTGAPVIVATGPLSSPAIAGAIQSLTGYDSLSFYDAIAPIVDGETIDFEKVFWASRYGKGGPDYLNCPLDKGQYERFVEEILRAEKVPLHPFECVPPFEACMPIEDLAARGPETLAHGPMRPTGLVDPKTGRRPYAVVQLRRDNACGTLFNMVGFQTKMTYAEQRRVFRLIPGLEKAEFPRLGSLHRNTFLHAPRLLLPTLQSKANPLVFFAGQLSGVEGYVESAATGILAGLNAARLVQGLEPSVPPWTTALGSLVFYLTHADPETFQPMHIHFGLFPPVEPDGGGSRKIRRRRVAERALRDLDLWAQKVLPALYRHGLGVE